MAIRLGRREALKTMGMALGALSLSGYALDGIGSHYFTHGVASGDPLADRVILWTRVLPGTGEQAPVETTWEVATERTFQAPVVSGQFITGEARDYTVKVDAIGLQPDTPYFYRFKAGDAVSAVGQTRTLPVGAVSQFRLGVASCSNYPQGFFNAYRHMAETDLDLVLHLGDYIYEYPQGGYANPIALEKLGRGVVPAHELLTLEDYRMRYGLYRTDTDLQAVHQRHPFVCVWDDHELMNNTWKEGGENHNPGEGDFHQRIAAARQAYHEWMPIRTGTTGDQGPIFRSFQIGDLADLIMLDTRLHGRDRGLEYDKDLPLISATFDARSGLEVSASEFAKVPEDSRITLPVPFDLVDGSPAAIRDFSTINGLTPSNLPDGWFYMHDAEAFKVEALGRAERTVLGADQEHWVVGEVERSAQRGARWQVLGQQVLMGKLGIPKLTMAEIQSDQVPTFYRRRLKTMQQLEQHQLPLNLDAWDGYPACRARVFSGLRASQSNPVVLAGDTHNAWAFNLKDEQGQAVGVEIGTPGINSPGMENYLMVDSALLVQRLKDASPELVAADTAQRGWTEVVLNREYVESCWHFVSTVLDRDYQVTSSEPLRCAHGARGFDALG